MSPSTKYGSVYITGRAVEAAFVIQESAGAIGGLSLGPEPRIKGAAIRPAPAVQLSLNTNREAINARLKLEGCDDDALHLL